MNNYWNHLLQKISHNTNEYIIIENGIEFYKLDDANTSKIYGNTSK